MTDKPDLKIKDGKRSTEFYGKVILQAIIIINGILNACGAPSLDVSPELTASLAVGLEAIWGVCRQYLKKQELTASLAIEAAHIATKLREKEMVEKSNERVSNQCHEERLIKLKFESENKTNSDLVNTANMVNELTKELSKNAKKSS